MEMGLSVLPGRPVLVRWRDRGFGYIKLRFPCAVRVVEPHSPIAVSLMGHRQLFLVWRPAPRQEAALALSAGHLATSRFSL